MKKIFLISAMFGLSACAVPLVGATATWVKAAQYAKVAADTVSYVATDKTLTEHAISAVTEKDCSFSNVLDNEEICQVSDTMVAKVEPIANTYNELAPDGHEIIDFKSPELEFQVQKVPELQRPKHTYTINVHPRKPNQITQIASIIDPKTIGGFIKSLFGKKELF